ncbi:MAG: URC4/urg3 family protein [Mycobacterium sp.]
MTALTTGTGGQERSDPGDVVTEDTERPEGAARLLRTTGAIRERSGQLLDRARRDGSRWFTVDDDALAAAGELVADLTRTRYPDLRVPFHSRWRHFEAGGVDRAAELAARLATHDAGERARTWIDLTVISVLLDAGAGPDWEYTEAQSGHRFARSEGLGVASWHAFCDGMFSSDPEDPLRVDAAGLREVTIDALAGAFQVRPSNPLVGLDGRVLLLRRLAEALADQPVVFGPLGRPGGIFDALVGPAEPATVAVGDILATILTSLAPIWPADNAIGTMSLGDCWRHDAVRGPGLTRGWVPFHKLSQWMTYSLLEPFGWAGAAVQGLDALTALPEYRNGGLLLDTGVLRLRDPTTAERHWAAGDELVVEWRALTVALLDELAPLVRHRLGADSADFPLACVLEGGTWAAGRALAQTRRGGLPPLTVLSDGTVF